MKWHWKRNLLLLYFLIILLPFCHAKIPKEYQVDKSKWQNPSDHYTRVSAADIETAEKRCKENDVNCMLNLNKWPQDDYMFFWYTVGVAFTVPFAFVFSCFSCICCKRKKASTLNLPPPLLRKPLIPSSTTATTLKPTSPTQLQSPPHLLPASDSSNQPSTPSFLPPQPLQPSLLHISSNVDEDDIWPPPPPPLPPSSTNLPPPPPPLPPSMIPASSKPSSLRPPSNENVTATSLPQNLLNEIIAEKKLKPISAIPVKNAAEFENAKDGSNSGENTTGDNAEQKPDTKLKDGNLNQKAETVSTKGPAYLETVVRPALDVRRFAIADNTESEIDDDIDWKDEDE